MTTSSETNGSECFSINGMHCKSCEIRLERALKKLPGVTAVNASHARGEVAICRTGDIATDAKIDMIIRSQGYGTPSGPALGGQEATRSWGMFVGSFAVAHETAWHSRSTAA